MSSAFFFGHARKKLLIYGPHFRMFAVAVAISTVMARPANPETEPVISATSTIPVSGARTTEANIPAMPIRTKFIEYSAGTPKKRVHMIAAVLPKRAPKTRSGKKTRPARLNRSSASKMRTSV
jgi:hypothetical protein